MSEKVIWNYWTGDMPQDEVSQIVELPTIGDLLTHIEKYGDKNAIQSVFGVKTYNDLLHDVARTRGFLHDLGVREKEHVAIHMLNEYDFIRLFLAVTSYGAVAVLIPMQTPAESLNAVCKKMDVKYYITNDMYYETVGTNVSGVKLFKKDCTFAAPYPVSNNLKRETYAAIMFTGGTTKAPKGVVLTHGNYMRGAYNGVFSTGSAFNQRYLNLMPFTHVFGLIRCCLTPLFTGSLLYCCVNPKDLVQDLGIVKPTYLILVPALADMLYGLSKMFGKDKLIPDLKVVIAGGAPVHPKLCKKFEEYGVILMGGYGLTESANLVSGNKVALEKPEKEFSVGMSYPNQKIKIGADGSILISGAHIMAGYYKEPELTNSVLVDGWFNTGDLGRIDEDGFIYVLGRTDNLIVLESGEKVAPEELEASINSLPYVKDCLIKVAKSESGASILEAEILPNDTVVKAMAITDVQQVALYDINKINLNNPTYMKISRIVIKNEDFKRSPSMKIIRG